MCVHMHVSHNMFGFCNHFQTVIPQFKEIFGLNIFVPHPIGNREKGKGFVYIFAQSKHKVIAPHTVQAINMLFSFPRGGSWQDVERSFEE